MFHARLCKSSSFQVRKILNSDCSIPQVGILIMSEDVTFNVNIDALSHYSDTFKDLVLQSPEDLTHLNFRVPDDCEIPSTDFQKVILYLCGQDTFDSIRDMNPATLYTLGVHLRSDHLKMKTINGLLNIRNCASLLVTAANLDGVNSTFAELIIAFIERTLHLSRASIITLITGQSCFIVHRIRRCIRNRLRSRAFKQRQ